ncbi:MAG: glycosyltransferase family 2 protein [Lachnospiraceae bacterium]|nr:glycosyltransferase family 2 protein [Lachnospiraceae bacterium]
MKITVFTPTYNRAYIIERLYRSLQRQTYTDFEWLVIDDGSSDNTEVLFEKWRKEERAFPIYYYKQENGGKCRAINRALDLAQGELFFTVDSDDYLTDDALEKIYKWESLLPKNEKFCGVAGNLGTSKVYTPNIPFKEEYLDKSMLERYTYSENGRKVLGGERAYVFYTNIHKKYRYPVFEGEKFMTEAVAWNRMAADGYIMRFYKDIIWIYEYREDGLTKTGNRLFINNPRGYGLWLREKVLFQKGTIMDKFKLYYAFTCELSIYYKDSVLIAESIGAPKWLVRTIICFRFWLK